MVRVLVRTGAHLVDDAGLVGCPRRGRDVPVEACLGCRWLRGVEHRDGQVAEIRCRAPLSARDEVVTPLSLLWRWGSER